MDDPIWDPSTFSKNRERLREEDVAHAFYDQVLAQARERDLLSDKHFHRGLDPDRSVGWAEELHAQGGGTAVEAPS